MKFNGDNLEEVLSAHQRWIETGGENDEDRADFSNSDLRNALLPGVNLYGAILRGADLAFADLYRADLTKADLTGANLHDANLYYTKMRGAEGVPFIAQHIPDTGSFIAWKRAKAVMAGGHYEHSVIVKLFIPEDAKRLNLLNGQCRASKALVLEVQALDGTPLPGMEAISIKDGKTVYKAGETVIAENFSSDLYQEHVPGTYFYMDRQRAVYYLTYGSGRDGNPIPFDSEIYRKAFQETGVGLSGTPPQVLDEATGGEQKHGQA